MEKKEKLIKGDYIDFENTFKSMLVKRYNWTVKNANDFNSPKLRECFEKGLDKYESYSFIFGKPLDLNS